MAAGSIVAGTLGILIPPSVTLILYGVATEQSVGWLFLAGVGPWMLLFCPVDRGRDAAGGLTGALPFGLVLAVGIVVLAVFPTSSSGSRTRSTAAEHRVAVGAAGLAAAVGGAD